MDKFGQIMKSGKDMSPAEMKTAMEKMINMCTCPTCPTYNTCAKNAKEIFFCGSGRSFMCISEEKGCICRS